MSADDVKGKLRETWAKVFIALNRFAALLIFIGMHWVLIKATAIILPIGWTKTAIVLEVVYFVAFGVLYLDQVWDMIGVFVPRLGDLHEKVTHGKIKGGADDD